MPPKPMEIYRRLLKEGWVEKSRKGLHCKLVRGASIIIFLFIEKSCRRVCMSRSGGKRVGNKWGERRLQCVTRTLQY